MIHTGWIWGKLLGAGVVVVLLAGAAAACSEASSAFGRPYTGRSLTLRVLDIQRLPVLQYSNQYPGNIVGHHRIVPSKKEMELVVIRLEVSNRDATNHLVTIDRQGAELRDFGQGIYFPVDVSARGESWVRSDDRWVWAGNEDLPGPLEALEAGGVPNPPNWDPRNVRLIDVSAPEGQGFLAGDFELPQGFAIDGWMLFEAPRGTKFRHIRWQAGDTITIPL